MTHSLLLNFLLKKRHPILHLGSVSGVESWWKVGLGVRQKPGAHNSGYKSWEPGCKEMGETGGEQSM